MEAVVRSAPTLSQYHEELEEAAKFIVSYLGEADVAVVLGSGLSSFSSNLSSTKTLSYKDIPHMPRTTVSGHAGELISGCLPTKSGKQLRILCFSGRVHWYEGFTFEQVNFLVRLAAACGCSAYILTNSAGGAIPHMRPGSAMIITDHIRFTRIDPLRDVVVDHHLCDGDLENTSLYSARLIKLAKEAADKLGETVYEGVYCWCGGPTYESPAEVQAAMRMGADAFGMSTVPEALAGRALGMEIFGISLCTNMACGLQGEEKLLHADVVRIAKECGPRFEKLLLEFFFNFDIHSPSSRSQAIQLNDEQKIFLAQRRILPIQGFWSGSNTLSSDTAYLQRRFQTEFHHAGVFVDSSSELGLLSSTLPNARTVSFSELVGLATISPNVVGKGRIICVDAKQILNVHANLSLLIVEYDAAFGPILDIESHHLVGVMSRLGIFHIVEVVRAQSDGNFDSWLSIGDIIDLTKDKTYPGFAPTVKRIDSNAFPSLASASICVFPGPTKPSPMEIKLAKLFDCDVYTCTSLSPVYSAIQSGLDCSIVACDCSSPSFDSFQTLRTILNSANIDRAAPSTSSWQSDLQPLKYHNSVQEKATDVNAVAAEIKGMLPAGTDHIETVLVVDSALTSIVSDFKWRSCIQVHNISGWQQDLGTDWRLSFGDGPTGRPFLCLYACSKDRDDIRAPLYDATFAVRVFKALGIETIVFVGAGISAQESISVGSVVGVSDHVNCSGDNPLFGPNEEEFGTRFPDLAGMYSEVPSVSSHVILGYLPNVSAYSSKFAECSGFQVYCYNLVPEALVARHSSMSIFSLLWISGSCVSFEKGVLNDAVRKEITTSLNCILG